MAIERVTVPSLSIYTVWCEYIRTFIRFESSERSDSPHDFLFLAKKNLLIFYFWKVFYFRQKKSLLFFFEKLYSQLLRKTYGRNFYI